MYGLLVENNGITPDASFDELLTWIRPLVEAEEKLGINDKFKTEKLEDSGAENK